MTVKQKRKKQIFWWLSAISLLLSILCVCLSSCQWYDTGDEANDSFSSVQQDNLNAKIVYHEAQLQSLSAQLNNMEQQVYTLHENYISELRSLEERLLETDNNEQGSSTDTNISDQESVKSSNKDDKPSLDTEVQVSEYTYRLENGGAVLTSYLGNQTHLTVPAAVDGYSVVGIADRAFADTDVQSVTLPETVEYLGWFTFYQCDELQRVVLPAKLSSIGYASFDGCASQLCLYVPENSYAEQFAISFGLKYQKII